MSSEPEQTVWLTMYSPLGWPGPPEDVIGQPRFYRLEDNWDRVSANVYRLTGIVDER